MVIPKNYSATREEGRVMLVTWEEGLRGQALIEPVRMVCAAISVTERSR